MSISRQWTENRAEEAASSRSLCHRYIHNAGCVLAVWPVGTSDKREAIANRVGTRALVGASVGAMKALLGVKMLVGVWVIVWV